MLKYGYSEKVEEEAVELLLTSIQAKMGIIDITKERDGVVSWDVEALESNYYRLIVGGFFIYFLNLMSIHKYIAYLLFLQHNYIIIFYQIKKNHKT